LGGLVPVGALDVEIEEELGLSPPFSRSGTSSRSRRGFGRIPLGKVGTRLDDESGKIIRLKLERFVGELFALCLVTTGQGALGRRDVGVQGLFGLNPWLE